MTARGTFGVVAATALLTACAGAPDERSYRGELFSDGRMQPVTTVLWEDREGDTVGRYIFREGDREVKGRLGPCEQRSANVLRCEWQDPYGTGYFLARFADDGQRFRGRWGLGTLQHTQSVEGVWHGQR